LNFGALGAWSTLTGNGRASFVKAFMAIS